MSTPVLEIRDLAVTLPRGADRVHAVEGVGLTVGRGEIVCLVGESGSGKSVIAHAIMGLLPKSLAATGGEIRLIGENLLAADESRLRALRCTRILITHFFRNGLKNAVALSPHSGRSPIRFQ